MTARTDRTEPRRCATETQAAARPDTIALTSLARPEASALDPSRGATTTPDADALSEIAQAAAMRVPGARALALTVQEAPDAARLAALGLAPVEAWMLLGQFEPPLGAPTPDGARRLVLFRSPLLAYARESGAPMDVLIEALLNRELGPAIEPADEQSGAQDSAAQDSAAQDSAAQDSAAQDSSASTPVTPAQGSSAPTSGDADAARAGVRANGPTVMGDTLVLEITADRDASAPAMPAPAGSAPTPRRSADIEAR